MALVLAVTLSWLIVEADMSKRKPPVAETNAHTALLQTLHPHAAGIDVCATEMWVRVPPATRQRRATLRVCPPTCISLARSPSTSTPSPSGCGKRRSRPWP